MAAWRARADYGAQCRIGRRQEGDMVMLDPCSSQRPQEPIPASHGAVPFVLTLSPELKQDQGRGLRGALGRLGRVVDGVCVYCVYVRWYVQAPTAEHVGGC